jgi:hypothetical protein
MKNNVSFSGGLLKSARTRTALIATFAFLGLRATVTATLVSWGFSGVINSTDHSGIALPSGIALGTPFSGIFTYDTALVEPPYGTPDPGRRVYYFTNAAGLSVWLKVGGHTITSVTPPPDHALLSIVIVADFGTTDEFGFDNSISNFRLDGAAFPEDAGGGFYLYLSDATKQAISSVGLPETAPVLSAFPTHHVIGFSVNSPQGFFYNFRGTITNISAIPQPILEVRPKADGKVQVAWPRAARGYQLESAAEIKNASWQPVMAPMAESDAEFSVIVEAVAARRFYRLTKPVSP